MIARVLRLIRLDDWWQYHLLPLLAVAYAALVVFAVPASVAVPTLVRLALSIACVAAYSHAVNDLGDADTDARAGKPNRLAALPHWQGVALGILLLGGGVAPWIGAGLSVRTGTILAAILVLQPAYALRPVRLKERGAWGLVADALHTHALPTLFCCVLFADLAGASPWQPFPLAATGWSFLVGLRGILYHQRADEANDRRARVRTFVTRVGSERAGGLVRRYVFPAELLALGVLGLSLLPSAPSIVVAFGLYAAVVQPVRRVGKQTGPFEDPAPPRKGSYVPLLEFYRTWPAVAFGMLLTARDPGYLPLLVVHTLVFARPLARQVGHLVAVLAWLARAPWRVARRWQAAR